MSDPNKAFLENLVTPDPIWDMACVDMPADTVAAIRSVLESLAAAEARADRAERMADNLAVQHDEWASGVETERDRAIVECRKALARSERAESELAKLIEEWPTTTGTNILLMLSGDKWWAEYRTQDVWIERHGPFDTREEALRDALDMENS